MGESVDVKALRARFHAKADMSDSSRESSSPKSPLPGSGRGSPIVTVEAGVTANGVTRLRLLPMFPSPIPGSSSFAPDLQQLPRPKRAEPGCVPGAPKPQLPQGVFPLPKPSHRLEPLALTRPAPTPADRGTPDRMKTTGWRLQGLPPAKPGPRDPPRAPVLPSQKSLVEVTPLRRPLPPEGPRLLKPRRPPHVNLDSYQRRPRAPPTPLERAGLKKADGSLSSSISGLSLLPSAPPRPPGKPGSLPRQRTSVHVEDYQEDTYDDIDLPPPPPPPPGHPGSWDKTDSWSDNSSSQPSRWSDESEIYDSIDNEDVGSAASSTSDQRAERDMKQQHKQDTKEQEKRRKKENEYKKKFKLSGEVDVLYVARVQHDWQGGGKQDLSVKQGQSVDILRVNDTPRGKWLARTTTGSYGWISNSCVDMDYAGWKLKQWPPITSSLPPPPPDPEVDSSDHMSSSMTQDDDDDYDDVLPTPDPELSLDPKLEKEFRTKFKYNGPINVLDKMMVDPNARIKRAAGKDLSVSRGEILDVIQITNDKKALCRNHKGKYGYVSRIILLRLEGDIYDDVDTFNDIYDNDSLR